MATKLNYRLAKAIRRKARRGVQRTKLAAEYGVSLATIGKIVRGEVWNHKSTRSNTPFNAWITFAQKVGE